MKLINRIYTSQEIHKNSLVQYNFVIIFDALIQKETKITVILEKYFFNI